MLAPATPPPMTTARAAARIRPPRIRAMPWVILRLLPPIWSDQKRVIGQLTAIIGCFDTLPTNWYTGRGQAVKAMTVQARRRVDVARILARFPLLARVGYSWRPLVGGLSHHIYLVETGTSAPGSAPQPR